MTKAMRFSTMRRAGIGLALLALSSPAAAQSTDASMWVAELGDEGEPPYLYFHQDGGEKIALFEGDIDDESRLAEFIFSLEDGCTGVSAARETKTLAGRLALRTVGGRGDDECSFGLYRVNGKMRGVMVLRDASIKFSTRKAAKNWAAKKMSALNND